VGADGEPELGVRSSEQGQHDAKQGVRTLRYAAAPAKRPARLDGRLSSDGRSARRREQAAGNTPTMSSQGSDASAARRPGTTARGDFGAHHR
jgi:hypothetical protein